MLPYKPRQVKPLLERLLPKIRFSSGCWEWLGSKDRKGYGEITLGRREQGRAKAHRVVYELIGAVIPEGLELDHLCRNPSCVNPFHLEPVTSAENSKRGNTGKARGEQQKAKQHCTRGHAYDAANTRYYKGSRICRACMRLRYREALKSGG